jgi:hypothetical protein
MLYSTTLVSPVKHPTVLLLAIPRSISPKFFAGNPFDSENLDLSTGVL